MGEVLLTSVDFGIPKPGRQWTRLYVRRKRLDADLKCLSPATYD